MWDILRGEPTAIIGCCGRLILAGMLLGVLSAHLNLPGTICSVHLIGLGAMGGTFRDWRTEHGLWMLAALFLVINCGIYSLMVFGEVRDILRGANRANWEVTIDAGIAVAILSINVRFLTRIMRFNWDMSRGKRNDE